MKATDDTKSDLENGIAAAQAGDNDTALALLRRASEHNPGSELTWLWRAKVAANMAEFETCLRQALEINPNNSRTRVWLQEIRDRHARRGAVQPTRGPKGAGAPSRGQKSEKWECPLCDQSFTVKPLRCTRCRSILSLAGIDELLTEELDVNRELVTQAVARLDNTEASTTGDLVFRFRTLGLAHLNLQQHHKALEYLEAASDIVPKDIDLKNTVETLKRHLAAAEEPPQSPAPQDASTREVDVVDGSELRQQGTTPQPSAPQESVARQPVPRESVSRQSVPRESADFGTTPLEIRGGVLVGPEGAIDLRQPPADGDGTPRAPETPESTQPSAAPASTGTPNTDTPNTNTTATSTTNTNTTATSTPNAGTTAPDTPNTDTPNTDTAAAAGTAAAGAAAAPSRGLILVVDDSPTIRQVLESTLEKHGFSAALAANGMEALAKIHGSLPDLIVLDVSMPHLDGYRICKIIKDNDLTSHIPVIFLTGKTGFIDRVRGRVAGAVEYISKPVEPAVLLQVIDKHLPTARVGTR